MWPSSVSNAIRNNTNVFYISRSVLYQKCLENFYKDKGTVKLNNFNIFVLNYKPEIFELFLSCKGKFYEFMYRIISSGLQNYCITSTSRNLLLFPPRRAINKESLFKKSIYRRQKVRLDAFVSTQMKPRWGS